MATKPPKAKSLSFEQLVVKVQQAEDALEAKERHVAVEVGQLKHSWREAWTPWRIVIAGLASGFVVGRADPMRALGKSGGLMQLVSMVSSLVAGGRASVAAEEASQANEQVQAEAAVEATGATAPATPGDDEALLLAQAEARLRAARTATVDQVES
ncbi:hypothetical protein QLQ15_06430 [Lysobacter sp. LF1]|uniref:Protein sip-5 n=1 Tax=Lysobacter stagni TaxID=3045172 RepID=A0ABT6XET2_9GAMM|nr:hypothetical protein [Lysobacter sp. LF1]MDI9238549.1 hypothetical protein [Lysobacter sp. LF1]